MKNPFLSLIEKHIALYQTFRNLDLGEFAGGQAPKTSKNGPKVLIFSPHPDDECITGGLALRLMYEKHVRIINVAVTLGSKKERRGPRLEELTNACKYLGFDLVKPAAEGFDNINLEGKAADPEAWAQQVNIIKDLLLQERPTMICIPHKADWNKTHVGTHHLIMDALAAAGPTFQCLVVETEYWGALKNPNVMLELSVSDMTELVAATSLHKGEIARNPYHIFLPAWMMDNVRRGGELVCGQGEEPPDITFAMLCQVTKWTGVEIVDVIEEGMYFSAVDDLQGLLNLYF